MYKFRNGNIISVATVSYVHTPQGQNDTYLQIHQDYTVEYE